MQNHNLTNFAMLIFLVGGPIYLYVIYQEYKQKQEEQNRLHLNFPAITIDLEQIIEKVATISGEKLLFDKRYTRIIANNPEQTAYRVSFPILLLHKPDEEEEGYLRQIFFAHGQKYFDETGCWVRWSDKGSRLQYNLSFDEIIRHDNQYYLNLIIEFQYV